MSRDPSAPARVAIGMPVFNGADYIAEAIRSVLDQTYTDLTLVVSDNASTDDTVSIVSNIAATDDRIILLEHDTNQGAVWNYHQAFLAAPETELFAWLCADDRIGTHYLSRCISALDDDPDIVGAYTGGVRIDPTGHELGTFDQAMKVVDLDRASAAARHRRAVLGLPAVTLFSVFRRSTMATTELLGTKVGGDRVFLAEMALRGRVRRCEGHEFARREHPAQYSGGGLDRRARVAWLGTQGARFEMIERVREHLSAIRRAPLPTTAKAIASWTAIVELPVMMWAVQVRAVTRRIRAERTAER